eukprot:1521102-Rhodomonas_salina.2
MLNELIGVHVLQSILVIDLSKRRKKLAPFSQAAKKVLQEAQAKFPGALFFEDVQVETGNRCDQAEKARRLQADEEPEDLEKKQPDLSLSDDSRRTGVCHRSKWVCLASSSTASVSPSLLLPALMQRVCTARVLLSLLRPEHLFVCPVVYSTLGCMAVCICGVERIVAN